jgi:photosystem II stability/assembly factor-like uncharacterized protein
VNILGGGFVTGIIYSQAEKDLVYARTDIGGAYRWDPKNSEWLPLLDEYGREYSNWLGIETLATDPTDPNRVYMAVGTYTQDWADAGAILRSTDRGKTWEATKVDFKMGGNENGRGNGERMVVDPNYPQKLLFGTRKYGLYTSEDHGATWKQGNFPVKDEPMGVGITFVVFDAKTGKQGEATKTVYAGFASTETGLYRSNDGGESWEPVKGQPKGVMPSHAGFDSEGTLYLSYGDKPGPSEVRDGAIWKYRPKSGKWTNITPLKPGGEDKFGYGGLTVSPSKKGTVMVTTIDRWGPGDEIFRTVDGGKKWSALGEKAIRDDAGAKYLYWGRAPSEERALSSTGWMAYIAIDPFDDNRAMYVTGQGVWATRDAAAADKGEPTHWRFTNENLEETAVKELASPPQGPELLSALGDICGFRHDDVEKPPPDGMFENPIFGNGTSIDFAESKPDYVVRVGSGSHGGKNAHGAISKDGGKSWAPFPNAPKGDGSGHVAVSADGSSIVWAPKNGKVSVSFDEAKTWAPAAGIDAPTKLPDWSAVGQHPAADRVNAKKFYVYDASVGKAFMSEDGGKNFTTSETPMPILPEYALAPLSVQTVPGKEGNVWVSTGKDLYRSTDSGKSYDAFLSVSEAQAVGFGKAKDGSDYPAVYIIAKVNDVEGIFRSDDAGESWTRINDDRHMFGSAGLVIGDPKKYGRVYLGTHGRGIIYGDPK